VGPANPRGKRRQAGLGHSGLILYTSARLLFKHNGEQTRTISLETSAAMDMSTPEPVQACMGMCVSTAKTIGMIFLAFFSLFLGAGIIVSLAESMTRFRFRVYGQRYTIATENSFRPGRDPFALILCIQMFAVLKPSDSLDVNQKRLPPAVEEFSSWFQFSNLQIPAFSLFKHHGLRHTCDDDVLNQFLGTVRREQFSLYNANLAVCLHDCLTFHFIYGRWN